MNDQMNLNLESEETTQEVVTDVPAAVEAKSSEKKISTMEEKRAAHEAAEAKRKAEWEATKKAKQEKRQQEIDAVNAMSADQRVTGAKERLGIHVERLTRRNMKLAVTEYLQDLCDKDPEFARLCMMPHKTMANCFRRIDKNALVYLLETAKMLGAEGTPQLTAADIEDLRKKGVDIPPMAGGIRCASGDVPDDFCFAWAEEYFRDLDAPEDKDPEDEFKEKPFFGGSSSSKKTDKTKGKGKANASATSTASKEKTPETKSVVAPKKKEDDQLSLFDLSTPATETVPESVPVENLTQEVTPKEVSVPVTVMEPEPAAPVVTETLTEVEKPRAKENIVSLNDKRIRDALETPITFSSLAGQPLKVMIDKYAGEMDKIVKNLEYISRRKLITPADQKLAEAATTLLELCYKTDCAA